MVTGSLSPITEIVPAEQMLVEIVPSTAVTNRDVFNGITHLSFACLVLFVD